MPFSEQHIAQRAAELRCCAFRSAPAHISVSGSTDGGKTMASAKQITRRQAELQPTRDAMASAMLGYFQQYAQAVAAANAAREDNRIARANGKTASARLAPLPPMGVAATVGLGKSNAVIDVANAAHAQGLPPVVLVPNHKLAEEHANRLNHLGAVVYKGRREPEQGRPNGPPVDPGSHACYRMADVTNAGDNNHRPAQGLCHQCPHGQAGVLKFVTRDDMRRQKAETFLKVNGLNPDTVPPCQFLYKGLPDQLAAPILIAPVQAFSEAMAEWREVDLVTGAVVNQARRLIIVDEHIPVATEVEIGAGDIKIWRNRLEGLTEHTDGRIDFLANKRDKTPMDAEHLEQAHALRALVPEIDALFRDVAAKIAGDVPLGEDARRIIDMQKKTTKVGASVAGTAAWEKVSYLRDEDDFFIPLRALSTLARNCKSVTMRQEKGTLFAYETSPLIQWARDKGSVMFLDATMSRDMRQFIASLGGRIHEAQASQNMRVSRITGRLYARGDVRKEDYPVKAQARMAEIGDLIAPGLPLPAAILTHKAYLKYAQEAYQADDAANVGAWDFEEKTGVPIGWFGKHDRGMDTWGGRHLALIGMPLLSEEAIAGAYATVRAAMADCAITLPEWDRVMDKDKADAEGPPMPVMPDVRAWLIDEYAQGVAQAIGRNRAVNHPRDCEPLQVSLWGGLQSAEMDRALRRYGVTIHDRQMNPRSYCGPKTDAGAVDAAIDMVRATGGSLSVRSVRAALIGLQRSASTDTISERLRELRAAGDIAPAVRVCVEQKTVCAAPAHITVEAAEVVVENKIKNDGTKTENQTQSQSKPQKQGQEKPDGATPSPSEFPLAEPETTVPNSYKDTYRGTRYSDRTSVLDPKGIFFAPAFDFTPPKAGAFPPDDLTAPNPCGEAAAAGIGVAGIGAAGAGAASTVSDPSTASTRTDLTAPNSGADQSSQGFGAVADRAWDTPIDAELEEMLSEVARAIEADLAREAEQESDPDDDPDPHQPGGGGAASGHGGSSNSGATHGWRDAPRSAPGVALRSGVGSYPGRSAGLP